MSATAELTTTALAPWFGSNRMLARHVGAELDGCSWVGVVFAGGMSELAHIGARSIVANDLHRHVVNLARVTRDPVLGPKLYRRLKRELFHPGVLAEAQARCVARDARLPKAPTGAGLLFTDEPVEDAPELDWAADYFVSQWMTRSGSAGTDAEFRGGISGRWDAGGGDSAVRYQSAVNSLVAWRRILKRCNFTSLDCFDFIAKVHDKPGIGIYSDAPFPDAGDPYRHKFTESHQRRLAKALGEFTEARVVIRFYDHPLIRELYPADRWTCIERVGRTQANGSAAEVLILNGPSRSGVPHA
jgi:DNA adenine methylase